MTRTYRLGVVGFAHMHINTLMDQFRALPNVQWVACADLVPEVPELVEVKHSRAWNLRYARETIGIPKVYADSPGDAGEGALRPRPVLPRECQACRGGGGGRRQRGARPDREADGDHRGRGAAHAPGGPAARGRGVHQLAEHLVAGGAHGEDPTRSRRDRFPLAGEGAAGLARAVVTRIDATRPGRSGPGR